MGIPVSIAVTPIVYGVALILFDTYNLVQSHPLAMPAAVTTAGSLLARTLDALGGDGPAPPAGDLLALFAVLVAPGVAVIVALWVGVRRLFRRSGVGAILLALGARDPRPSDLEEHQLANLVDEMAIAAGLNPPRTVLLDSDAANAAIVGSSDADATLVVSRRLLDVFSREETEAIVAHLIGSMSDGDLRIAFTLASVFETFGLLIALLDAPFSRDAREVVRRLLRLVLRRPAGAAEAGLLAEALSRELSLPDDDRSTGADDRPGILAPLLLANVSVKWSVFMFSGVVVGPAIAFLWRTRRYLADATAIQLTRNPDALWSALSRLIRDGGLVPGSISASYLFIVGPESIAVTRRLTPADWKLRDDKLGTNSFVGFHPPIGKRLERIRAQGAKVAPDGRAAATSRPPLVARLLMVFVWGLFGVGMAAAFAAVGLFLFITLFFSGLALGAVHGLFLLLSVIKSAL